MATKVEILELTRQDTGYTREVVRDVVDSFLNNIQEMLTFGEIVSLYEFGTFKLVHVKEQKKIFMGEEITIPEHSRVSFKVHPTFREKVWDIL